MSKRKRVAKYRRVSTEEQARGSAVSLDQQDKEMNAVCERMDWEIAAGFTDCENYIATKKPRKGKMVNPSGKRNDRPGFLALLDLVRTGTVDIVLCWRDDRLYRHERVVTALKDAMEDGEAQRNGREIEIHQVTGLITKDFMYLQAMIWRRDNERRVERTRMGKVGTLEQGRWPGVYDRLGYETVRDEGKRGNRIVLADEPEVKAVRDIFSWCASGLSLQGIRKRLIALGAEQKRGQGRHAWNACVILRILRSRDYIGEAAWCFGDDTEHTIEIPAIVDPKLWQRCQDQLERNKTLATRNAKEVYLLQGILKCGECGRMVSALTRRYRYYTLKDGTKKRTIRRIPSHRYVCPAPRLFPEEDHPRPYAHGGVSLEWAVWRHIVDYAIKQPEMIKEQVIARQEELQAQGESIDGDVAHARGQLAKVERERAFYQRQAARGKMTEIEFDARMGETEEARTYWLTEIERLKELRDDAGKVEAGLTYASKFLRSLQERLAAVDLSPQELRALSREHRQGILEIRRDMIRALCDTVYIYADGHVRIDGALDGTEAAQFDSIARCGWQ